MQALAPFEKLNPRQHAAACFGDGPWLILADAGKTNTLARRMAHLVQGVDPQRLLLLTFTRRAALEMTRRVQHVAGEAVKNLRCSGRDLEYKKK